MTANDNKPPSPTADEPIDDGTASDDGANDDANDDEGDDETPAHGGKLCVFLLMIETDDGVLVGLIPSHRPPLTREEALQRGHFPSRPYLLGSEAWWAAFRMAQGASRVVALLSGVTSMRVVLLLYANSPLATFATSIAALIQDAPLSEYTQGEAEEAFSTAPPLEETPSAPTPPSTPSPTSAPSSTRPTDPNTLSPHVRRSPKKKTTPFSV